MRNLILALIIASSAFGQNPRPDALKPEFSHQYFFWQQKGYHFIDTSLNSLNWYHQLNNAQSDEFGKLVLMNMGGARNSLLLPELLPLLQYHSFGPYQDYFTNPNTIKYYQVRSPLTGARYVNGYERGQLFRIYHTQNINKNWNFALEYRRLNSLSFYINDQNKQSSFTFNTHYKNKKGSYEAWAYVASEKMDLQENGGILYDSIFTDNLETARTLLLTNLDRDQRVIYNRDLFLDHRLDFYKMFRKKRVVQDTLVDSLEAQVPEEEPKRSIILGHQFRYNRRAATYEGFTTDFYDNYFFENDGNYKDSIRSANLYNEAYLQTILGDSSRFDLKLGAFHQLLQYGNQYFNTNAQHLGFTAQLQGNYLEYFDLNASAKYIFSGPFANDFELKGTLQGKLYKSIGAFAGYSIQNKHPELFQQLYISNNVLWNIAPGPILTNEPFFGLQWGTSNYLRLKTFSASNWVFFNNELKPEMANEIVAYQSLELRQDFMLWSWLHQDNRITYQIPLGGEQFLPLPELVNRHALYFKFPLFKGALQVLMGAEGTYFSSFNSPSYSALTGQMYLANEYEIGNYIMLDAFAQFKVSKAVIFLKMQNLGQGLMPYNYWAAPHYPLNDRVFRVGVNWRFFN